MSVLCIQVTFFFPQGFLEFRDKVPVPHCYILKDLSKSLLKLTLSDHTEPNSKQWAHAAYFPIKLQVRACSPSEGRNLGPGLLQSPGTAITPPTSQGGLDTTGRVSLHENLLPTCLLRLGHWRVTMSPERNLRESMGKYGGNMLK